MEGDDFLDDLICRTNEIIRDIEELNSDELYVALEFALELREELEGKK